MKKAALLGFLLLFLWGCAAPRMYVYTLADPDYSDFSRDKKVVIMNKASNLEEKRLKSVLTQAMNKSGFEVVSDIKDADLGVIFEQGTVSKSELHSYRVPITKTTTGYIGEKRVDFTTHDERVMTYTHRYTLNKLQLNFYSLEDAERSNLPIWEAYGGLDDDLYKKYEEDSIKSILKFYGRDYDNWTYITLPR